MTGMFGAVPSSADLQSKGWWSATFAVVHGPADEDALDVEVGGSSSGGGNAGGVWLFFLKTDGTLEAGVITNLRVDFRGPQSLGDLLGRSVYEAPVRVIIEVDEQEDADLETPPMASSPQVAT